jgi:hypothetical protein
MPSTTLVGPRIDAGLVELGEEFHQVVGSDSHRSGRRLLRGAKDTADIRHGRCTPRPTRPGHRDMIDACTSRPQLFEQAAKARGTGRRRRPSSRPGRQPSGSSFTKPAGLVVRRGP